MKMKNTIEYIGMLGTAIIIWRAVQKNGTERLKEEGGEESLSRQIDLATEYLYKIDPKVILDEICADSQGIKMRLDILNDEYRLQKHLDIIDKMLYQTILLPTGNMAFDAMEDLKGELEIIWQEITDVIEIAKKHIPQATTKMNNPSTKKPTSKWWKDGKLEEAQAKFKGQEGSATVRAILRMAYDPDMPLPKFKEFKMKFPDVIKSSEYYRVRNEFKPLPQIEKNAIK